MRTIVSDDLKHAGILPASRLLIDRRPRWKIMRQKTPLTACFNDVPHGVE
jgi:hypothetical protein